MLAKEAGKTAERESAQIEPRRRNDVPYENEGDRQSDEMGDASVK